MRLRRKKTHSTDGGHLGPGRTAQHPPAPASARRPQHFRHFSADPRARPDRPALRRECTEGGPSSGPHLGPPPPIRTRPSAVGCYLRTIYPFNTYQRDGEEGREINPNWKSRTRYKQNTSKLSRFLSSLVRFSITRAYTHAHAHARTRAHVHTRTRTYRRTVHKERTCLTTHRGSFLI